LLKLPNGLICILIEWLGKEAILLTLGILLSKLKILVKHPPEILRLWQMFVIPLIGNRRLSGE
jgi:hypothetical protein